MANTSKSTAFKYRAALGVILLACVLILSLPFSSMIVSGMLDSQEIKNGISQMLKSSDESKEDAEKRTEKLIENYIELLNKGYTNESKEILDIINEENMYMYFGKTYLENKDNPDEILYEKDQQNIDVANEKVLKYLKQYVTALRTDEIMPDIISYIGKDKTKDDALTLISEYDNAKIDGASDTELKAIIGKYISKNSSENIAACQILVDEYVDIGKELFNSTKVSNTALNMIFGRDIFGNANPGTIPYFLILGIAPITAFLAICFDNKRNIKYVISIIASLLCIIDIIIFIRNYISYGSLVSIILYIIVIPLSILGAIANNMEYSAVDDKKLEINKNTLKDSKHREIEAQKRMANNNKKNKKKKK